MKLNIKPTSKPTQLMTPFSPSSSCIGTLVVLLRRGHILPHSWGFPSKLEAGNVSNWPPDGIFPCRSLYKVSKLTSSDNVAGILPEKSLLLRSRATRNFSLPISSGMVPPILLLLIYKDGGILPRSSYCRTAEVSDIENRGNCCCCRGRGKTTIALRLCREGSLRLGCWCPN
ncbi:uncharacterized protein LOC127243473 isoform X2 [Andrographis paniculata]|uniref:uncharacterized protein LOC127243473 isoform X2 n=1 Tax=Andrographis paniculata TaxID=175694 RepID=UPI0021E875C5|nr:uncharacterized protein LOC127243473 isoform X2 [Andrographis paniculata]